MGGGCLAYNQQVQQLYIIKICITTWRIHTIWWYKKGGYEGERKCVLYFALNLGVGGKRRKLCTQSRKRGNKVRNASRLMRQLCSCGWILRCHVIEGWGMFWVSWKWEKCGGKIVSLPIYPPCDTRNRGRYLMCANVLQVGKWCQKESDIFYGLTQSADGIVFLSIL